MREATNAVILWLTPGWGVGPQELPKPWVEELCVFICKVEGALGPTCNTAKDRMCWFPHGTFQNIQEALFLLLWSSRPVVVIDTVKSQYL